MEFITGRPRTSQGWSIRDRTLAEALTEYEALFCTGCNQRRDLAWDDVTSGHYEAHEVICSGCAAKDEREKQTKERQPGSLLYVTLPDDFDVAKARAERDEARAAELAAAQTRKASA